MDLTQSPQNNEEKPQPRFENKKERVFVIMPSGMKNEYEEDKEEADFVYNSIICEAVKRVFGESATIEREIDKRHSGSITHSIIQDINRADYCIVDITGLNANVMFELGIRYALKRSTTILIRQKRTEIPFDIQNNRTISYSLLRVDAAINDISNALRRKLSNNNTDSPVFEALSDGSRSTHSDMTWGDFWDRVDTIIRMLRDRLAIYRPHVICGITNGGMIVAECIHHRLYRPDEQSAPIPLLSLWAKRGIDFESQMIDNDFNIVLIEQIKKTFIDVPKIKLLLIDDNINTGRSAKQAIDLFERYLGEQVDLAYLPLIVRRSRLPILNKFPELIWKRSGFNVEGFDYSAFHTTDEIFLPYKKELLTS